MTKDVDFRPNISGMTGERVDSRLLISGMTEGCMRD